MMMAKTGGFMAQLGCVRGLTGKGLALSDGFLARAIHTHEICLLLDSPT